MSTNVRQLAQQIAARGRNGDSTLMHIQPVEIAAIERLTGKKATVNPQTGMKEGFAFLIPLIASLVGSIGGSVANKLLNNDKPKTDESAAGDYIKQRGKEALSKYDIPIIRYGAAQGAPQQGYTPGVDPEKELVPIRQPIQFGTPGGQLTPTPPGFAEGGMIPEQQDAEEIYHEAEEALMGTSETPEESINRFVQVFGEKALRELMAQVQQMQQQPQEQQAAARGGMLKGPGGGMDDLMRARVHGGQPVALSGDEYVVPADAVSMLGDGSSDQGGRKLDAMVQRVRMAKTGRPQQAGKVNDRRVMPA